MRTSPEESLLQAMELDKLTDKEAKYLKWLLGRPIPNEKKREFFKRKFPGSRWLER